LSLFKAQGDRAQDNGWPAKASYKNYKWVEFPAVLGDVVLESVHKEPSDD